MKFHLNKDKTMLYVQDKQFNMNGEYDLGQVQELLAILPAYEKRMKV